MVVLQKNFRILEKEKQRAETRRSYFFETFPSGQSGQSPALA
jgi:hypothetical protein